MTRPERGILAANAGSSSLKLGLYALGAGGLERRARIVVSGIDNTPRLSATATTMSMTPLDGLPMGTRSGQVDPGVILYLQTTMGMTVEEVTRVLDYDSGLLGMSDVSAYMDVLLASPDPRAAEAVDYFVHACATSIGALAAALGGLDAIVFTAGIGEQSPEIRRRILQASAWLGADVDERANEAHGPRISTDTKRCLLLGHPDRRGDRRRKTGSGSALTQLVVLMLQRSVR